MNIRKPLIIPHAITALALTAALTFSCVAEAVSIGEIVLQSKLGEPLLAQVDLVVGKEEVIEDDCLSLVAPDPLEVDTSGYLTQANLTLKIEGKRQYVAISSRQLFNDAFARLRLQVKCPDTGSVIKTLTILPDLDLSVPQAPISAPVELASKSVPSPLGVPGIAPDVSRHNVRGAQLDTDKATHHAHKQHLSSARVDGAKQGKSASFRLKLSGEPLDESRIGKVSEQERALLLARQKLLDADDQMASFLAMQNQVKQLQEELGEIKLKLAQLGANPSTSAPSPAKATTSTAPAAGTTSSQGGGAKPVPTAKPPVVQQNDLSDELDKALGLVLVILVLWLGRRYYAKVKSRNEVNSQQDSEAALKTADEAAAPRFGLKRSLSSFKARSTANNDVATAPQAVPSPVVKSSYKAPLPQAKSEQTPAATVSPMASPVRKEAVSPTSPPQEIKEEATEEDSMLEEAGLYASHGRPAKAIEILQEIIQRRPSKAAAWPLLLSIYSSLAKATEFEKTAREFLKHHPNSPAWSGIQALGRTFDQSNPLYVDGNNVISSSPLLPDAAAQSRRPVGDVLIEMGVLSKQDLQNCLDDFDPKKHGRFGGYLVARKAITLAQLDQALLQQQGVHNETKSGALPSLQDMENFLADFDPKRDGSVGEFLASRNAATPEQLSKLLQHQPSQEKPIETQQADDLPPSNKTSTLDFVLESTAKLHMPDLEFESATETSKPSDSEVDSSALDFPKIDFDMSDTPPSKKLDSQ